MHKAIVLDIEGTVGPISFVHEVLFPYSTERMLDYLRKNEVNGLLLDSILKENKKDFQNGKFAMIEDANDPKQINAYLQFLIREDRKFGPLKTIQGHIWKEGFELGDIKSELFSDVPDFLKVSKKMNMKNYIYSSGSVQAQILFFQYSIFGDLQNLLDGYFDTNVGGKKEKESYIKISQEIGFQACDIAFFTDIKDEADAAKSAGYGQTYIMNRPGNKAQPNHSHPTLDSFIGFFEN